ncbi:MAG: hypothetical protein ACRDK0_13680 [Solirubrobacteraceae bacterium]
MAARIAPILARREARRPHPVYRGIGVPDGDGRPVMLIPGFMAGDGSLGTLTHWLCAAGC